MRRSFMKMDPSSNRSSSAKSVGFGRGKSSSGGGGPPLSIRQARAVKKIMSSEQELKYKDYVQAAVSVTTTTPALTGAPFDIAQGVSQNQRVADSLTWCGWIDLKLRCVNATGATGDTHNNIRVVIFQWFANQSPAIADVLLAGPSTIPDVWSNYNHDRRHEYRILFDKVFTTVGSSNSATFPATDLVTSGVRTFKISLAKARKNVQYVGNTLTGTNRFYISVFSDSTTLSHPTITYTTKVVFRDG